MNEDKKNFLFSLKFRTIRKIYCLIWKRGKIIPIGYLKIDKCNMYIYLRNNSEDCPYEIFEQFLRKYGS